MARRGLARPRPAPPPSAPEVSDADLPRWAEKMIANGKLTEEEYRERRARRPTERREDLLRRVPPAVRAEGPAAVEAWTDEWSDPRRELSDTAGNPRAPLPWSTS